jgi:hypothetical protein
MEKFEREGKKFWKRFGENLEQPQSLFFDLVNPEEYRKLLDGRDLQNKKVLDIGAGFPTPKEPLLKEHLPLASELQEILENFGAKIIAIDVSGEALKSQKTVGRCPVLGNAFQLPFQNESIDGGAIILNLFNASFRGTERREIFITIEECKKILEEVYRVLQRGTFVIISNFGYCIDVIDNLLKISGPEDSEIITPEMIIKLAEEVGFRNIRKISLDMERFELAIKLAKEYYPEALRDRIKTIIKGSGALFMEK